MTNSETGDGKWFVPNVHFCNPPA